MYSSMSSYLSQPIFVYKVHELKKTLNLYSVKVRQYIHIAFLYFNTNYVGFFAFILLHLGLPTHVFKKACFILRYPFDTFFKKGISIRKLKCCSVTFLHLIRLIEVISNFLHLNKVMNNIKRIVGTLIILNSNQN